MAKSWTISGISDQTREAVMAAAAAAGMPVGAWIEQALSKALVSRALPDPDSVVVFTVLAPLMIALGALSIGAVGFKLAQDNLANIVFGTIGLMAIMGAAFAIDAIMDEFRISTIKRLSFLGFSYLIFSLVVAAMSPVIIVMVILSNAANSCPNGISCPTTVAHFNSLVWAAIAVTGISVLFKLMSLKEWRFTYTYTVIVFSSHVYAIVIIYIYSGQITGVR